MIQVIRAKLHCIRVTDANLDYQGSITLDPDHCWKAGINPLEFVDIWNKNSGARLSTYVIFGKEGSRVCTLNGAAARTCQIGDELIIAASALVDPSEIYRIRPKILVFGPGNKIVETKRYEVTKDRRGRPNFRTVKTRA